MGEVILLRHGQTEWSKQGRHTGRTDVPLTAQGEQQAKAARVLLAGRDIRAAWSSPAVRARLTAELAGVPVRGTDADLWEWDYGGYEGFTTAEVRRGRPGWFLWADGVVPGAPGLPGETVEQVGERCDRVISRVRPMVAPAPDGSRPEGDVALVGHGHVLRVLAARWLGLPPASGAHFQLDTASVSRLGFEHALPVLTLWNETVAG